MREMGRNPRERGTETGGGLRPAAAAERPEKEAATGGVVRGERRHGERVDGERRPRERESRERERREREMKESEERW